VFEKLEIIYILCSIFREIYSFIYVLFTSPKEKMFLALARAERGEREGEPDSDGLIC
jgi:hypothetical protein